MRNLLGFFKRLTERLTEKLVSTIGLQLKNPHLRMKLSLLPVNEAFPIIAPSCQLSKARVGKLGSFTVVEFEANVPPLMFWVQEFLDRSVKNWAPLPTTEYNNVIWFPNFPSSCTQNDNPLDISHLFH